MKNTKNQRMTDWRWGRTTANKNKAESTVLLIRIYKTFKKEILEC